MYYWGYFRSTDTSKDEKGQLYKVVIITDFQNTGWTTRGGKLTLSSSPFNVSYQGEDNNLFKPYKCSTATVSFYLNEINKDLYSLRGNDIYVSLLKLKDGVTFVERDFISGSLNYPCTYDYKEYSLEWVGFATPNAYNQSFNSEFNLYELEAQDALSTLQYYEYKPVDGDIKVQTLSNVVKNIIASLGIYTNIYITDSLKVPVTDYDWQNILSYLYINERNFYNEDLEPEKMLEVLGNILQYLSLTAIPYGDSVYIVDYNAIANGFNTYHQIKYVTQLLQNNHWLNGRSYSYYEDKGIINLTHIHNIDNVASSDINYSLSSTFNKAKVVDDFYFAEPVDMFDKLEEATKYSTLGVKTFRVSNAQELGVDVFNINVDISESYFTFIYNQGTGNAYYNKYYGFESTPNLEVNTYWWKDTYQCDWVYGDEEEGGGIIGETFNWVSSTPVTIDNSNINYDTLINYAGCTVVDESVVNKDYLSLPKFNKVIYFTTGLQKSKQGGCAHYHLPPNQFRDSDKAKNEKLVEFTLKNQLISKDDYILLNGDFSFFRICAPLSECAVKGRISNNKVDYIWAKLECNGYYWNGESWQSSSTLFKLKVNSSSVESASIIKNVGFPNRLSKQGYGAKVPFDGDGVVPTDITLTFYRIFGLDMYNETELSELKNFEFEVCSPVSNILNEDVQDSNVEYTNTINDSSLEEYKDINTKITTYCGKNKDYSSLLELFEYYTYGETRYRFKYLHNVATGNVVTPEEHIISNICRQYKSPNIILDISLHGTYKPYSLLTYHHFNGSKFVVDSMTINYADDINTLRLVEKLSENNVSSFESRAKKRDYQRNGDIINNAPNPKKDNVEIYHPIDKGNVGEYQKGAEITLRKLGTTDLLYKDLDFSEKIYGYCYTWFDINSDGELVMYRANRQKDLSGKINDNGELELITNSLILIN